MTKSVLIIDEIENIITSNEKKLLQNLLKINDLEQYLPIILITNDILDFYFFAR